MLDSKQIQAIRMTVQSVLAQCDTPFEPTPFDHDLYQKCVDEAIRRDYPMDGDHSVRTFLKVGVVYAMTAGGHLDRPVQIWLALWTSCLTYVDEIPYRFPSETPGIYSFNERFIGGQRQPNAVLNAFADIVHWITDLYQPVPARLITTSSLNYITSNLLEHETASMQIASMATRYPIYYRVMTGLAEGYAYMAFSRGTPLKEYLQAIPEIMLFISDMNDVLSFYKEELAGEKNNQIAVMARRNKESSHLNAFAALADKAVGHYAKALAILQGSRRAREEFRHFAVGYIGFHVTSERYKLADLNL